ncbi:N-acetylmuramoyl-L-alanine amidase [Virgibacillus halodenitrificans]|uniref:N-acetylmuramoyl-L-alanine amidase family protein n=1 Tax=Virgibacillus halodenitrificans TaxID=1482 RepID=UPI001F3B032A|nr:N-acetylmuramoyl-L-alanine amidase [Virgibacillus halodenitrificans]MCG1029327.1 N-acetylmuramoyl-L-alanine amidase [Virgibacillus halodenitrificans]
MTTIAIDIGHGSNTFPPSKGVYVNGKGYHEHEFNAKTAVELDKLLKHNGFRTVMKQKPFRADVSLTTRTNYYNSIGVDLVWSIHANANSNKHVEGRCAFYWYSSKNAKRLAQLYVDECHKAGFETHGNGLHASKPDSWTNLHICRETNMVALLTENGFMTNDEPGTNDDFELLFGSKQKQYVKDMARVHAKALCRYFGKTFRDYSHISNKPEEELSVNEAKKLQKQIDDLEGTIKKLNNQLKGKIDTPSKNNTPDPSHEHAWEWLVKAGISNGDYPHGHLIREQFATLLYKYQNKNEKLPDWMYDAIVDQFDGLAPYLQKPDEWKEKLKAHDVNVNELLGVFILAFLNKETAEKDKTEPIKEDQE